MIPLTHPCLLRFHVNLTINASFYNTYFLFVFASLGLNVSVFSVERAQHIYSEQPNEILYYSVENYCSC